MASVNPYRYAGYRYDEETKLYYLMARYYNPDTGVFLSLDPVRGDTMNPITMNGYNYANNNPVMNVDPDGNSAILTRLKNAAMYALKKYINFYVNISSLDYFYYSFSLIVARFAGSITHIVKQYNAGKVSAKNLANKAGIQLKNLSKKSQKEVMKVYKKIALRSNARLLLKSALGGVGFGIDAVLISAWFITGYFNKYSWRTKL